MLTIEQIKCAACVNRKTNREETTVRKEDAEKERHPKKTDGRTNKKPPEQKNAKNAPASHPSNAEKERHPKNDRRTNKKTPKQKKTPKNAPASHPSNRDNMPPLKHRCIVCTGQMNDTGETGWMRHTCACASRQALFGNPSTSSKPSVRADWCLFLAKKNAGFFRGPRTGSRVGSGSFRKLTGRLG